MSSHKDNEIVGVKAEPKFLRGQTRFEQITSFASHVGTTLTNSLPKRRSTPNAASLSVAGYSTTHFSPPAQLGTSYATPEKERVTFASFDHIEVTESVRLHTLNLGYPTGFQLWDITSPDNVHELCSIKDEKQLSNVRKVIVLPRTEHVAANAAKHRMNDDSMMNSGPLIAILAETTISPSPLDTPSPTSAFDTINNNENDNEAPLNIHDLDSAGTYRKFVVQIYSLQTQKIVTSIKVEDDESEIVDIRANGRIIVIATTNPPTLHLYSTITFKPIQSPITDISTVTPIYSLGSRLLAYASTLNPQVVVEKDHNHHTGTLASLIPGYTEPGEGIKVAKEVLGGVASGVRSLGEIGFAGITTLTGYLSAYTAPASSSPPTGNHLGLGSQAPPALTSVHSHIPSVSSSDSFSSTLRRQSHTALSSDFSTNPTVNSQHDGVIAIRDSQTGALMTCFRSYNTPIRGILFNPTGAHILTTFSGGQTFHIHAIQPPSYLPLRRSPTGALSLNTQAMPQHLIYRLSRGITSAEIESFDFSQDGLWCSVSTARGTTHIFPVHPIGPADPRHGTPTEIPEHVGGRVKNVASAASVSGAVNISAIVRIKQRNGMIDIAAAINGKGENGTLAPGYKTTMNGPYHGTSPSPPRAGFSTMDSSLQAKPAFPSPLRAHLISSFLPRTRNPYLLTNNVPPAGIFSGAVAVAAAKGTLKGVAGKIGSWTGHVNGTKYPHAHPHPHAQTTAAAPSAETADHERVFNFDNDEEEFYDSLHTASPAIPNNVPQTSSNNYDIYTFNPAGILTLHRLWVGLRKDEHVNGGEVLDIVAGCEDIAEWKVLRAPKWAEVRANSEFSTNIPTTDISPAKHVWLAQAEIQTYEDDENLSFWFPMQLTFNHFQGSKKELEEIQENGGVPAVKKIYETAPVKEVNDSKKVNGPNVIKNGVDIAEDISTAMNGEIEIPPALIPPLIVSQQPSPAQSVYSIVDNEIPPLASIPQSPVVSQQPSPAQSVYSILDNEIPPLALIPQSVLSQQPSPAQSVYSIVDNEIPPPALILQSPLVSQQPSPAQSVYSILDNEIPPLALVSQSPVISQRPSPAQSVYSIIDEDLYNSHVQQETNATIVNNIPLCKPSLNAKKKHHKKGSKRSRLSTPEPKEGWGGNSDLLSGSFEIDLEPEIGIDSRVGAFIDLEENHW